MDHEQIQHTAPTHGTNRVRVLGIISLAFGILLAAYSTSTLTLSGDLLRGRTTTKKQVDLADVSIKKEGPVTVASNEDIVEHIIIQNLGPQAVKKIRLREQKGTTMPLVQATIVDGEGTVTCKKSTKELSCVVSLPNGLPTGGIRTVDLSFATHAAEQQPPCGAIFESPPMKIELEGTPEDLNPANDTTGAVSTTVDCTDITNNVSIRTTPSSPPRYPSEIIKYTVDITNYGPGKAAHLSFKHRFPRTLEFVNASIQNCTADSATNEVTCALGDDPERSAGNLINGESAQVELNFRAGNDAGCTSVETATTLTVDQSKPDSTIDVSFYNNMSPLTIEVSCPEPISTETAPPQS